MQRLDDAAEYRLPRSLRSLLEKLVVGLPERGSAIVPGAVVAAVVRVRDPALLGAQPGNVTQHPLARNHQIEVTKNPHRVRHIPYMRRQIIDQSRTALVM